MDHEAAGGITPEQREAVDKALAPHREDAMKGESLFYGVDMRLLPREDLLALCFWIAANSRDHRRDQ